MKLMYILIICFSLFSCSNGSKEIMNDGNNAAVNENNSSQFIKKYDDGSIKIQGTMIHGRREGHWETFYPNGTKQSESNYKNGKLEGKSASYYMNGNTRYVGQYLNDKQTGSWYFYREDGGFEKEVLYENGKIKK